MSPSGMEQLWNEMRCSDVCGSVGTVQPRLWHKMAAVPYVREEGGYGG